LRYFWQTNEKVTDKKHAYDGWHKICYKHFRNQNSFHLKIKLIIMSKHVNITPLHDRVIVKPAPAEEKTAGGIIIPDTAKEKPQRGTVVAAGPGKKDEPMTVKPHDTILYGKYAGTEISLEGVDYLIMRESDILAII
jgi:chaperonin GroES